MMAFNSQSDTTPEIPGQSLKPSELTRDYVRRLLLGAGLTIPHSDQIAILGCHITRRLIEFNGIRESYRVHKIKNREIRVKSYYFKSRQGVSFEDGFVGIAGWADSTNLEPILVAIVDWVKETNGFDGWRRDNSVWTARTSGDVE